MEVVIIFNGLGNQMSQYAFYLQKLSLKRNSEWIEFCSDHNGFELDKVFGIAKKQTFKNRILYLLFRILLTERLPFLFYPLKSVLHFLNIKIIKHDFKYHFDPEIHKINKGIRFYFGGWHTELYFKDVRQNIFDAFSFNDSLIMGSILDHLDKIKNTNSISLHIRRGDFLNSDNIELFGNICNLRYYARAIEIMNEKIDNPHFFIFSNDLEWAKSNFNLPNVTYIDGNFGNTAWIDMFLMKNCKHHIIANSSFSWWGAWLNKHENKIVISPNKFCSTDINSEVYPESWIKIDTSL